MILTKFEELHNVVNLFNIKKQESIEIIKYENDYLDTDFSDIFTHNFNDNEMYTILRDGTVRKTVVYISENPSHYLQNGYFPKYHIYNCANLQENIAKNKKYVKISPLNEKFLVLFGKQRKIIPLKICGTCYKQYIGKYGKTFNLSRFLSKNKEDDFQLLQLEDEFDSIPKIYAKNWNEMSSKLKKLKNYTCEECGLDLSKSKKFLHTHHIDHNPRHNVVMNLKVLCIECHSKQEGHEHLKSNNIYHEFIELKQKGNLS